MMTGPASSISPAVSDLLPQFCYTRSLSVPLLSVLRLQFGQQYLHRKHELRRLDNVDRLS